MTFRRRTAGRQVRTPSRIRRLLLAATGLGLAASVAVPASANASSVAPSSCNYLLEAVGPPLAPGFQVRQNGPLTAKSSLQTCLNKQVPPGTSTNPGKLTFSRTSAATGADATPDVGVGLGNNYISASNGNAIYPNGNYGAADASFSSDAVGTVGFLAHITFHGNSGMFWGGLNPYNYTTGTLENTWGVSGLSLSVSYPTGIGISGSGNRASQGVTNNNAFYLNESFGGIEFSGIILFTAGEAAGYNFLFGSQDYYAPSVASSGL